MENEMTIDWPLCRHSSRYAYSPDITKTCGRRASAPCANCGKPLCDEHVRDFDGRMYDVYGSERLTLHFCDACVDKFKKGFERSSEKGGADDEHDAE